MEPGPPFDIADFLASQSFQAFTSESRQPGRKKLTRHEEKFLQKMIEVVLRHLRDPDFDTRVATKEAGLSRMHLNRKLRAIAGCSTHEFILALRFRRARELLREDSPSISDVAHAVGFRSPSHFAKAFRKHFGLSPSEFIKDEASKEA
jgi:transcriptional regulator GlxA family with amidase domain